MYEHNQSASSFYGPLRARVPADSIGMQMQVDWAYDPISQNHIFRAYFTNSALHDIAGPNLISTGGGA
jgi:hypothetical protein